MADETQGQVDPNLDAFHDAINELDQSESTQPEPEVIEDASVQPEVSTEVPEDTGELTRMQKIFGKGKGVGGTQLLDYSGGGFLYSDKGPIDFYKPGGDFQKVTSAPALGLLDTMTDAVNLVSPKGVPNIPKVPEYEEKQYEALRDISGLVIPSLALRGMALNAASKYHASGAMSTKLPWLYKLGNKKSFAWFSERGVDMFTGGLVDFTAQQNAENRTLADSIVEWYPKTNMFIPNYLRTGPDSTANQIRLANVLEGGVFNVLAGVVEGTAYITKNGKSLKRTAKFTNLDGSDNIALNKLDKGKYDDVVFDPDNPIQDAVLRNQAYKQDALNELGEYYASKGELPNTPTVGLHAVFDANEDLVLPLKQSNPMARAQVNAAEIRSGLESPHGRITRIVSEAQRKHGLELENIMDRTMVSELTTKLKETKKFKYKTNTGHVYTEKVIKEASDHLAATLLHPRVDKDAILGVLEEFKRSVDDSVIRIVGKKGISKAVKQLKEQMVDLDVHKARAYLVHSDAGAISDIAEGARLIEEGPAIQRAAELMADRVEVLMIEKGLANFEANSMYENMKAWKLATKTGDKETINQAAEVILENSNSRLTELIPKAKKWSNGIKEISKNNPEFLKPFLLASELTDGDVDSLFKLHMWAQENLGVFHKILKDGNPNAPSIINKAALGNVFNAVLSAPPTPIAAGIGNLTGLLGKSQAQIWGAALSGDFVKAKQAMVAWYSLDETLNKATKHMKVVFRKASTNPKEISYAMRGDIALKETKELTGLRSYAEAASKKGEDGASALLRVFDDLEDMAADPLFRWGSNSMSGFDGFSKSVLATSEAKYRALWQATKEGTDLSEEAFKKAYNDIYDSFIDDNGMLSNIALDANAKEIALNADSPMVDRVNDLIRVYPIMKTFIWFPRTTANVLDTFSKWSPGGSFSADWYELWGWNGSKTLKSFKPHEKIEHLTRRGKPVDEFYEETFEMLRYEVKGKAAISGTMLSLAFLAAANDRCTGTGHVNKSIQNARNRRGWKKKSCKVPGTNQTVSYEWMGPLGDWMSLAIDIVDNADTLTTGQVEAWWQKLWIIGANTFTDKRVLTQLEPMFDVFQGNGAAANRHIANLVNNSLPLGSARNWLGKMMYPQLREIRSEFNEALRNRNAWLDAFDKKNSLANKVDPVDGKPIGGDKPWLHRLANSFAKVNDNPSPVNQWLIDIEYPTSPNMKLSLKGALLENHEIEAINTKMGQQGIYKKELQKIKAYAESLTYTDPNGNTYKGFREVLRAARRGNVSSEVLDIKKFAKVFNKIHTAYNNAKRVAERSLENGTKVEQDIYANIQAREFRLLKRNKNLEGANLEQLYKDEYDTSFEETLEMFK